MESGSQITITMRAIHRAALAYNLLHRENNMRNIHKIRLSGLARNGVALLAIDNVEVVAGSRERGPYDAGVVRERGRRRPGKA